MSKSWAKFITLLLITVIALAGYFVIRHQQPRDVYREYMNSHEPWRSYEGTKDAIYLMNGHTMIIFESSSNRYWTADLNDYYQILHEKIGCNNEGECTRINDFQNNYPIFGAVFSASENFIKITFEDSASKDSREPIFYYIRSTLDGKDIRVTE